jgi:hypothetical protein
MATPIPRGVGGVRSLHVVGHLPETEEPHDRQRSWSIGRPIGATRHDR